MFLISKGLIAVFVPPDVDVEVTVLRFCSNFIGFGMDEIKTAQRKYLVGKF